MRVPGSREGAVAEVVNLGYACDSRAVQTGGGLRASDWPRITAAAGSVNNAKRGAVVRLRTGEAPLGPRSPLPKPSPP